MDAMPRFDPSGFEILDEFECLRLLGSVPLGRLVFTLGGMPAVRLVNFAVDAQADAAAAHLGTPAQAATDPPRHRVPHRPPPPTLGPTPEAVAHHPDLVVSPLPPRSGAGEARW